MNAADLVSHLVYEGEVESVHVVAESVTALREKYDAFMAAGGTSVVHSSSPGVRRHSGYVWHSADVTVLIGKQRASITISTKHEREAATLEVRP